jgi:hypothetical protein
MGKLFDRVLYEHFNITDKDGSASVKKDIGKYKVGDNIKLRLDYVEEKIIVDGKDRCVISVHF